MQSLSDDISTDLLPQQQLQHGSIEYWTPSAALNNLKYTVSSSANQCSVCECKVKEEYT